MNKNEKYKKIAELLLERIIILEKELRDIGEMLENDCKNNVTKIHVELGDFIPLVGLKEILKVPNIELESIKSGEINYDISTFRINELNWLRYYTFS